MRILFLSLLVASGLVHPSTPSIESLSATASATTGDVRVRFALANGFRDGKTIQSLESGLPTSFVYIVEMFRDRPRWFDESIGRSRIEVIATFNSLTREYLLNYRRDRKLVRSETFSDIKALEERMTTIDEPSLFSTGSRKPYKLKVRARADLTRGWLFYFIPWQFSTRWREARVVVGEAKP